MNVISFSGIAGLEFQLNQLKKHLVQFADAKDIELKVII